MEIILREILNKAVFAPSGDNSQPWWFRVDTHTIEIHLIPDRDNPILNYRLSGSYLAHGCLIRNIEILATTQELAAETTLLPDPNDQNFVARIRFQKNPGITPNPLAAYITKRCTNRKPYFEKSAPQTFTDMLGEIGERVSDVAITFTAEKKNIRAAAKAVSVMERTALETAAVHKLFFETIIWTKEEEREAEKGLYIKTLELPPPIQLLFHLIRHWWATKALNYLGLSRFAALANAQTYATAPLVGIVSIPTFSITGYIKAGMAFQEIWLAATKDGLALQPVSGLLFLAQRIQSGEKCPWDTKRSFAIIDAYHLLQTVFRAENRVLTMLFRVGYADEPTARSTKRPPSIRD